MDRNTNDYRTNGGGRGRHARARVATRALSHPGTRPAERVSPPAAAHLAAAAAAARLLVAQHRERVPVALAAELVVGRRAQAPLERARLRARVASGCGRGAARALRPAEVCMRGGPRAHARGARACGRAPRPRSLAGCTARARGTGARPGCRATAPAARPRLHGRRARGRGRCGVCRRRRPPAAFPSAHTRARGSLRFSPRARNRARARARARLPARWQSRPAPPTR